MGWGPTDYLFTAPSTGAMLHPSRLYAAFKAIAQTTGMGDFYLHDLWTSTSTYSTVTTAMRLTGCSGDWTANRASCRVSLVQRYATIRTVSLC